MAKALARLIVKLEAESSRLTTELEKTRNKLNQFEQNTKKSTDKVKGYFKSLGAFVSAGVLIHMGKSAIDAGDKINKLNDRIGASVEALSQYQHVAELTGVSFNALAIGWQRQTRRISEAAAGTGEAKKALDELGLSAKGLNKLKPEQQFEVLADAIMKVEDPADRVRLAFKFWDSEGVAMLQTIKDGSEGLRQMRAEADRLGLTLTKETANKMSQAKDEIAKMDASLRGMTNDIVIAAGPAIIALANAIGVNIPKAINGSVGAVEIFRKHLNNLMADIHEALAARSGLEANLLPSQKSVGGKFLNALGIDATAEQAQQAQREHLEKALGFRVRAAEAAGKIIEISEKLNQSFDIQKGSAFDYLNNAPEIYAKSLESAIDDMNSHVVAYEDFTNKRIELEKKFHNQSTQFRMGAFQNAVGFLQALSVKSKGFALAALALETTIAAKRVLIESEVAAVGVIQPPPIGLGIVAGAPIAAAIRASGYTSAAFIGATGIVQASNLINQDSTSLQTTTNEFPAAQRQGPTHTVIIKAIDSKDVDAWANDNREVLAGAVDRHYEETMR